MLTLEEKALDLALELDKFAYDYDTYEYMDNSTGNGDEVTELVFSLMSGHLDDILEQLNMWLDESKEEDEMYYPLVNLTSKVKDFEKELMNS